MCKGHNLRPDGGRWEGMVEVMEGPGAESVILSLLWVTLIRLHSREGKLEAY